MQGRGFLREFSIDRYSYRPREAITILRKLNDDLSMVLCWVLFTSTSGRRKGHFSKITSAQEILPQQGELTILAQLSLSPEPHWSSCSWTLCHPLKVSSSMAAFSCHSGASSAKPSLSFSASSFSGSILRHPSRPVGASVSLSLRRPISCQISSSTSAPPSVMAKGLLCLCIFLSVLLRALCFLWSFIHHFMIFPARCL